MALSDLSFKFYTDSGLTSVFSNLYQIVHKTDLSDNPQDFQLWFGSNATSTQLQASASPGVTQISLTPADIEGVWTAGSTVWALGQIIEPTASNGFVYKCTTTGTGAAVTQPTWPTSVGSTVTDGTAIWTCYAIKHPATEIKLAATAGGLPAATGGGAMNLGTTILSGSANAVQVNIRITNTVTTANSNTGWPQLGLNVNAIQETAI
jgi:hypothetical protein